MNAERLLKMATFLEALPPHMFCFKEYVKLGTKSPLEALADPEGRCGTTACAVGWMPAVFPAEIKWVLDTSWRGGLIPTMVDQSVFDAYTIREFLNLTVMEYDFLFIPDESLLSNNATAVQVAAQIREFVAGSGDNMDNWLDWEPSDA